MKQIGPVAVTMPAEESFARVLRMLMTSVASSAGLEVDRVENVALATDEAFGQLVGLPGVEEVRCATAPEQGVLGVTVAAVPAPDEDPGANWPDALADRVLRNVAEEIDYRRRDATIHFRVGSS